MDTKVRILIACHKQADYPKDDVYLPIQVGKSTSKTQLGIQTDDTGDNISEKNYSYCELTALYWAWKNLKNVDIVGLCHYRRYFDFHKQSVWFLPDTSFPVSAIDEMDFSVDPETIRKVQDGGVVVCKALHFNTTLKLQYDEYQYSEDFRTLQGVFEETQNERYRDAFSKVMVKGYKMHPYNMMMMRWTDFDSYCQWLFDVLSKVEERTDISHYSTLQKRIYGFMSERLLNVWLLAEHKAKIEKPMVFIDENCNERIRKKFAPRKTFNYYRSRIQCALTNFFYRKSLSYYYFS